MKKFLFILFIFCAGACHQKKATPIQNTSDRDWWLWAVDWHPSGNEIVAGGTQDTLRLFSSLEAELIKNVPVKGTITKTKWHPSKNLLAYSTQNRESKTSILNMDTGQSIELDSLNEFGERGLGWNKDGSLLAVGDYSGILGIYKENGELIKQIATGQKAIIALDWHPSQDLIAAVGERITLYDLSTNSMRHIENREHEVLMLCVEWHPSGSQFVTGDYGDFQYDYPPLLQFWTDKGVKLKSIAKSKGEYRNMKWSKDGTVLATASEKLRLWDMNGDIVSESPMESLLWGVDWNNDDSKLVTTDSKGNLQIWDRSLKKIDELKY